MVTTFTGWSFLHLHSIGFFRKIWIPCIRMASDGPAAVQRASASVCFTISFSPIISSLQGRHGVHLACSVITVDGAGWPLPSLIADRLGGSARTVLKKRHCSSRTCVVSSATRSRRLSDISSVFKRTKQTQGLVRYAREETSAWMSLKWKRQSGSIATFDVCVCWQVFLTCLNDCSRNMNCRCETIILESLIKHITFLIRTLNSGFMIVV